MRLAKAERRAFHLAVAKREIPRGMALAGSVFVAVALLNWAAGLSTPQDRLIDAIVCVLLVLGWGAVRRPATPDRWAPWIFAGCATAVLLALQIQIWNAPSGAGFAYVITTVIAAGALTLAWIPLLTASVPVLAGCVVLASKWPSPERENWIMISVAALALGFVILAIRLESIDALAEAQAEVRALATRDQLTGLLNRHGVEDQLPKVAAMARRQQADAFVLFVDIDGLKAANDLHGHEFGDAVITEVARAVRDTVRAADVVGRWGGDEFIVIGVGSAENPERFQQRVAKALQQSHLDPAKWGRTVSVGGASGSTEVHEFEDLLAAADADMYARRRGYRSASGSALA